MAKTSKKSKVPAVLLIDLIDEDEVAEGLPTESKIIITILGHRPVPIRTRLVCIPSLKLFRKTLWKNMPTLTHVHLAGHGDVEGICTIDGVRTWKQVATSLKKAAPKLGLGRKRVLTLSCCHSEDGMKALRKKLDGHFTGCYHLTEEEPDFHRAITVWSMFYSERDIGQPHQSIVDRINGFFAKTGPQIKFRKF